MLRPLCRQKGIGLVERNALSDPIHVVLSIPPKYSVAMTLGYLKGQSAVRILRNLATTKGTVRDVLSLHAATLSSP